MQGRSRIRFLKPNFRALLNFKAFPSVLHYLHLFINIPLPLVFNNTLATHFNNVKHLTFYSMIASLLVHPIWWEADLTVISFYIDQKQFCKRFSRKG